MASALHARASIQTVALGRRREGSPSRIAPVALSPVKAQTALHRPTSRTTLLRGRRLRLPGSTRRFRRRRASSMSTCHLFALYVHSTHPYAAVADRLQAATPPVAKSPASNSAAAINNETYQQDGDYIKDIEINDLRNRYTLTKGATQKRVNNNFCCSLIV